MLSFSFLPSEILLVIAEWVYKLQVENPDTSWNSDLLALQTTSKALRQASHPFLLRHVTVCRGSWHASRTFRQLLPHAHHIHSIHILHFAFRPVALSRAQSKHATKSRLWAEENRRCSHIASLDASFVRPMTQLIRRACNLRALEVAYMEELVLQSLALDNLPSLGRLTNLILSGVGDHSQSWLDLL